jgi:hypothetical protein
MLQITNHTTKREFLQMLTNEAGKPEKLLIEILSLPTFLNTQVAFTIFNYQISNYPRNLVWLSDDPKIINFLKECNAEIGSLPSHQAEDDAASQAPSLTASSVSAGYDIPAPSVPEVDERHTAFQKPLSLGFSGDPNSNLTQEDGQPVPETKKNGFAFPSFGGVKAKKSVLTVDDLFEGDFYQPSTLIDNKNQAAEEDSSKPEIAEKNDKNDNQSQQKNILQPILKPLSFGQPNSINSISSQNLDSWLEKIAATKVALHSLRDQAKQESTYGTNEDWAKARPRSMYLLAGSLAFSLFFVGFLALFPTKAFTLEVDPGTEQTSQTLNLKVSDFSKKVVKLSGQSNTNSSGKKEVPTERAVGKVSLINPSAGDVDLNNGQFRLINDDKQYEAISNPTLPSTFAIPARNNLNGPSIEINVQARQSGAEFNQPENIRFTIVNLLGQRVCGGCYGVSITPIKNSDFSGQRIVSEADYSLLRSSVEADLAQKRINEIKSIQDTQVFTNINWYRNLDSSLKYDKNLGDAADTVSLKQDVSTDLFYLTQSAVEDKLKEQNPNIAKISDLALAETTGGFESDENTVKIKLFYTFSKTANINKDEITKTLSSKDCGAAQTELRNNYPDVKSVECKDLGLKMPGIPSRVDLNIINKD